jgi:hypothetical protein
VVVVGVIFKVNVQDGENLVLEVRTTSRVCQNEVLEHQCGVRPHDIAGYKSMGRLPVWYGKASWL